MVEEYRRSIKHKKLEFSFMDWVFFHSLLFQGENFRGRWAFVWRIFYLATFTWKLFGSESNFFISSNVELLDIEDYFYTFTFIQIGCNSEINQTEILPNFNLGVCVYNFPGTNTREPFTLYFLRRSSHSFQTVSLGCPMYLSHNSHKFPT